jgi:hypothetical protein
MLSALISPLSSLVPALIEYTNTNREVSCVYTLANGLVYPEFTKNIVYNNFKPDYHTFVTDYTSLSHYITTVNSVSSQQIGYSMKGFSTRYDTVVNSFKQSLTSSYDTQFLGIVNGDKFNLIPLKTKNAFDNSPVSDTVNVRRYQKMNDFDNSKFLQYKIDTIPNVLEKDSYSLLFNSYNVTSSYINNMSFVQDGAIGGDSPLNSDMIFFDQNEYGLYTNNGNQNVNSVNNGTLLCLWLSSQNPTVTSDKIWMERWYDANTVSQGNALIANKNYPLTSFGYIADYPSNKIVSPKEKLVYLRYGENRNDTFVNSLSSDLTANFSNWNQNFVSESGAISGFVVGDYNFESDALQLDGGVHAHIPPVQDFFIRNDMSVSLWSNGDFSNNVDSQLFGNYYNETGYGIFYNTGTPTNLISIPTVSDNLFALNSRGYKVFEKDLKQDLGLADIEIRYVKTDIFGNRWLYDKHNQYLYKMENDDLVIKSVKLPSDANIAKIDCYSNNNVAFLNTTTNTLSTIDSYGTFLSSTAVSSHISTFEIDLNDSVVYEDAEFLAINRKNQRIKTIGPTVLIDDVKVLHLNKSPIAMRLDLEDNIWFLIDNNIVKLSPSGDLLFSKKIQTLTPLYDGEICFVKSVVKGVESINLWVVFNSQKFVAILNSNGDLIKRINLLKIFAGKYCSDFDLSVKGDFTGFDNKRKFENIDGLYITPRNASFTLRLGLECGNVNTLVQMHHSVKQYKGWTHLGFILENSQNKTLIHFIINGNLVETKTLNGNYKINYGYKTAPFIMGGHSGKLGAKNLEKSIIGKEYFVGQLDDVRVYNKALNLFEMQNLALYKYYKGWTDLVVYTKCPPMTIMEELGAVHINRYKGFKSNQFNIKIKNITNDPTIQSEIKRYIKSNISHFIPANTVLNDIIFE